MKFVKYVLCFVYCLGCLNLLSGNVLSGYSVDEEQEQEMIEEQYCYSCSGKSALCRKEVYDGKYLTKTSCKTQCFLRVENNEIYRGCFDGWLGGLVKHNYEGCKLQKYLGQTVEWCFCSGHDDEPCNSQSRESMGGGLLEYTNSVNDVDDNYDDVYHTYPLSDYGSYLGNYRGDDNKDLIAKEGDDDHYKLDCYECNDDFPYCGTYVTNPEFIGIKSCVSKCFIRKEEAGSTYRGCFDGFTEMGISYNYNGCKEQFMSGSMVELCLCDTHLCNGKSMDEFRELRITETDEAPGFGSVEQYAKEGSVDDEGFGLAEALALDNMVYKYTASTRLSPNTLCRGLTNGVYTDPFDCTMYVNCLNGFTYRRRCPPGTAWNVEVGFCDYAHKVVHMCQPSKLLRKAYENTWIVDEQKNPDTEENVSYAPNDEYRDFY